MYFGARYYDPALGTFISADSIVVRPGDPVSLNRYTYSANNPMRYNDPTGHDISDVLHTLSDFGQGVAKQWGYDNAWLLPMTRASPGSPTRRTDRHDCVGRHVGNVLAAVQGVAEFGAGGGAALGGGVLCLTGIGCIAGGEVAVAGGVVVAVHGGTTAINAAAQEGALLSDLYMMAKAPKGTASGSGSSRGSQPRTQVRSDWSPASIGDPQYLNGCEGVAKQIKGIVGGDIKRIVPKQGQVLGGFGKPGQWAYGEWAYHEVVVRDRRVFDAFTGHEGMSIEQYKSLWRYADAIILGSEPSLERQPLRK